VLVDTGWLHSHLEDPDLVVVDLRWREDGLGRDLHRAGHIPGAVFLDWASDLVDPEHPVAFMLAPPDRFAEAMRRSGIGEASRVVAYADRFGSGPYRLWWACRAYGHDQVRVLDGGLEKWLAEGRPLSAEAPAPRRTTWSPRPAPTTALPATAEDVAAAELDPRVRVLDSRPHSQFRGQAVWFETGPVRADADGIARTPRGELRAGRVPWAANVPVAELFHRDRTMRSPAELRQLFARAGVPEGGTAITYCGVGISASALLFALHRAGFDDARLYDSSWEEWGRDPSRPVARDA
jgi:thiosulfate/3-mercaptopyruvate sulfurtransferase